MNISRLLYVARRMKSYIDESAEECTILHGIEEAIITAKQLEDRIIRVSFLKMKLPTMRHLNLTQSEEK